MTEVDNLGNRIGWILAYSFVILLVFVSNVLIMVAFTTKALRRRSSYQVINLSVADLAVGIIVMPLFIQHKIMTRSTSETNNDLKNVLYFTDLWFGLASIWILTLISCERLYAVAWPYKHRLLQKRYYVIALVIPWFIAAVDAALDGWPAVVYPVQHFQMSLVFIPLGLIVICSCYMAIWMKKTSRFQQEDGHVRLFLKHKKLAKTLCITTVASLLTWLPFYLYIIYFSFCSHCPEIPSHIWSALKLLQFSNSFINGVIYSLRIREFRGAIRRVFHRVFSRITGRLAGRSPSNDAEDLPGATMEMNATRRVNRPQRDQPCHVVNI